MPFNPTKQREYKRRHREKMLAIDPDYFKKQYTPKPRKSRTCKTCGAAILDQKRYCSVVCRPSHRVSTCRVSKYSTLPQEWRSHKIFNRIVNSIHSEIDRASETGWDQFAHNLARILRLMNRKKKAEAEKVVTGRQLDWESMARRASCQINKNLKPPKNEERHRWAKRIGHMASNMRQR